MEDVKSSAEAETAARKLSCRLYPSLPKVVRHEVSGHQGAAAQCLQSRSTDAQEETTDSNIRLKDQILILEKQNKELLLMNEKWAREYQTMKEFYIEKVRELRAILQRDEERCEKSTAVRKKVDDKERVKLPQADEVSRSTDELAALRVQNSFLTRSWQHQTQEIRRLNKALHGALQSDVSSALQQDVWKHQADVYREDFLKERSDREKLHRRYLDLEKKYRKACHELRIIKPQAPLPKITVECWCRNHTRSQNPTDSPCTGPRAL